MASLSGRTLLLSFAAALTGAGLAPVAASQVVLGGSDLDRGVSVAPTADGGFVAAGVTRSRGAGGEDVYLIRLGAGGEVVWETTFGGTGDDDGWSVLETAEGGFVVGGFSGSTGAGGLDCYLAETDARGTPVWSKTFGGEEDDRCWAVTAAGDGGYLLAGETASSGSGERDCYLVRTDGQGRELWSKTFGGEKDDRCFSVVAADDGGFVIAGQTYSHGAGDRDAWVLKVDRDGTLEWSKTHGGAASDVAHSVVADGRGSFLVTGYTTSLAETPDDPMVLKISRGGTLEWSRVIAMDGHNRTLTGALAAGGGLCLAGFSVSGAPPEVSALAVKLDDAGQRLWSSRILPTSEGESFGYGVAGTTDGGCAIVGHTTEGSAGGRDLLFARVDAEGRSSSGSGRAVEKAAEAFLRPYVEGRHFSGSVLIASGEQILFDAAYGWASLEHEVPNSPRTRYQIGSISKTFTAAAILLLQQRGSLSLDDPIRRFLPDFPNGDAITVRHLLGHTSGLPRFVLQPDYGERSRRHHATADLVDWAAGLPPSSPPGKRAAYSNANYALLAAIIEEASGREFGDFLDAEICEPLGLHDTGHARDAGQVVPRLAQGYHPVGGAGIAKARLHDYTTLTGAGSLYSTTHDLRRWVRFLRSGDLLSEQSLALLFSRDEEAETYAWAITEHAGRPAVSAQGWDGVGFAGKVLHLQDEDLTVIVLGNLNISSISSELVSNLTAIALGEEYETLSIASTPGDSSALRELTGLYRFGPDFYVPGTTLELVEKGGELLVEGPQPGALLRVSANEFIHRQHWFRITFERDESGRVTGMNYGGFEARRETDRRGDGTRPQGPDSENHTP